MTVYLVGAGPGDPGLLTVRGAELLRRAEVVVYDRLASPTLLALAPAGAELITAGKAPGQVDLTQEQINAVLVEQGATGRTVVRLKGGDPFVFGRGGEEAEACHAAGVPVEVVPGVSAALAAGAAAQIALTHRDVSSVVSFVAGQCKGLSEQNWAGLAGVGRTLVIYMGVATAEAISEKLMADGLAPDASVAIIENAGRPQMRVLRGLLAGLGALVADHAVRSPALIVVGEVTARGDVGALAQIAEMAA